MVKNTIDTDRIVIGGRYWTDYPITEFGDPVQKCVIDPYQEAPVREVTMLEFDGDKYCKVLVNGIIKEIKAGYIYTSPQRIRVSDSFDVEIIRYCIECGEVLRDNEDFVCNKC
jgi:hypothetical protein